MNNFRKRGLLSFSVIHWLWMDKMNLARIWAEQRCLSYVISLNEKANLVVALSNTSPSF